MSDEIKVEGTGADEAPVTPKKKRGRKPNPEKNKMYFSDREEEAFVQYINSTDDRFRNKIFNDILYPAFTKMVESIIRKYTLFKPGEEFEDTFNDVMSHLISKMEKFDPTKLTKDGKKPKAYSYCGTVCKNYALHERQKAQDRLKDTLSYELVYTDIHPDLRVADDKSFDDINLQQALMTKSARAIEEMIARPDENGLNSNDVKVGLAIVNVLRNWDTIFNEIESKKYNKSQVDLFIKEFTSLGTKQVRESKKKYQTVYYKLKEQLLKDD